MRQRTPAPSVPLTPADAQNDFEIAVGVTQTARFALAGEAAQQHPAVSPEERQGRVRVGSTR